MDIIKFNLNTIYNLFTSTERKQLLPGRNYKNDQASFAYVILPGDFFIALFKKTNPSKTTAQRIFANNPSVLGRFEDAKKHLLGITDPENGSEYKFGEAPFWKTTLKNWNQIFDTLAKTEPDIRKRFFSELCNIISRDIDSNADCSGLFDYLTSITEDTVAEGFTCLSLVASTIPFWNEQAESNNQFLYDKIVRITQEDPLVLKKRSESFEKNKEFANREIIIAREHYVLSEKSSDSAKRCYESSKKILDLRPMVLPDICSEAAYMIFKLADSNEIALPKGESAYDYLEQSNNLGFYLARADWSARQTKSLLCPLKESSDPTVGTYIINCDNERAHILKTSIPDGWNNGRIIDRELKGPLRGSSKGAEIPVADSIAENTFPNKRLRYFFIDDDFKKNLQQTLLVLQTILDSKKIADWDVEVYLRAEEEVAEPIIDTALSHMGAITIPVYILDDEKRSAQLLLAYHPLFYPLSNLSDKTEAELNVVVLGDSRCAEWVIKESSWLLTFRNKKIHPKIVILGKNSPNLINKIYSTCPGMIRGQNGIPTSEENIQNKSGRRLQIITDVEPVEIEIQKTASNSCVDLLTYELNAALDVIFSEEAQKNKYYYFVVATEDDALNFTLAKRLRENIIRNYILSGNMDALEHLPVIAFHSADPDLSHVSHSMVAQLEDLGNRWYNNYSLIPFGSISRYHWDRINGGILEEMAKCIHLQYCSCPMDPNDHSRDTIYSRDEAMHDYYGRFYNRDSSFAMAIGLSYRLFQSDKENMRTIPSHWSIINETTFSDESSLYGLSRKFEDAIKFHRDKEYDALSRYEHSRWIRFMYSRSWMPATPEQTVAYLKAQKTEKAKHQLYIAKLHPCMCDYDQLDALHKYIVEHVGTDYNLNQFFNTKDFKKIDLENIKHTGDLLRRAWFVQEPKKMNQPDIVR